MKNFFLILLFFTLSCKPGMDPHRIQISLEGEWQFALDTASVGENQKWFLSELDDHINLPGTTDLREKGFLNRDTTTRHLNRVYKYAGIAWYRKEIQIPENLKDKHITLFLERTKSTKIWVDSIYIGGSKLLQSPQEFDVSEYLTPGKHHITVQVNNDLKLTPYGNVHIYSDDTQTNWNGIIGEMYLEAAAGTFISDLRVYPDIERKKIGLVIAIDNGLNLEKVDVTLLVEKTVDGKTIQLKKQESTEICNPEIRLEYNLDDHCELWDEYEQPLYRLTAVISNGEIRDAGTVHFGMRNFGVRGTQFEINGRTTFLRGKHEAAVFPLTGYPPMDVEGWQRVYRIAKNYGINHYRFHSYCPPEAAFTAADREGIYLQAELPFWGGLTSDSVALALREEGYAMLKSYGNHPSFVMFSHGNEIWDGLDRVEANILAFKAYDNRPLYTMGCNNKIGYVGPRACSDYFVAARTPYDHDTVLTHTRLSHAYVDSRDGGILNSQTPSTEINFNYAVSQIDIPIVSHEIGQYQIYPDFSEIRKYTGVLKPWNLEIFRKRLEKSGMSGMDSIFRKASGAWAAACYRAEMEAAIRTEGLAGFQLLDLQDFPGQGTALVGILDAFMDSKNVITAPEWKRSCNDVVLLLEFPGYCWETDETFRAQAVVANYSDRALNLDMDWEITTQNGSVLRKGTFSGLTLPVGKLTGTGEIRMDPGMVEKTEKLNINMSLRGTEYANSYPVWIYKSNGNIVVPDGITVMKKFDDTVIKKLQEGSKVLLFPDTNDVMDHSVPGLFTPDFWNYGMFRGISQQAGKPVSPGTLGLLTDPDHPLFNSFPTEYHTNWQWFNIVKNANPLILDNTPQKYRPLVQVIDNLERNHKLGLIFEFRSGEGKLLVCMSRLDNLGDEPEASALYRSILGYMDSSRFDPETEITPGDLASLFNANMVEN